MKEWQEKLVKMLGEAGLMDKELKFWQLLRLKWPYYISPHLSTEDGDIVKYTWFKNKYWTFIKIDRVADPVQLRVDYDIIGQYHLGSILQLIEKKGLYWTSMKWHIRRKDHMFDDVEYANLKIDFTVNPMERTESQNKELVTFLKGL